MQIIHVFDVKIGCQNRCPEKCLREKSPPENFPPEKLLPGKMPPRKIAPRKNTPMKIAPQKNAPQNVFTIFSLLLTLSYSFSFLSFLIVTTTIFIMFWDIFIDEQIFFPPQVKRSVIISNKHSICKIPHELPNDLRLRILGNQKISGKYNYNLVPSLPPKMKILSILAKNC